MLLALKLLAYRMIAAKSVRPIIISGPSGVGKGTLLNKLFQNYPDSFSFSVSHTTRAPREGEQNGREYNFVQKQEFIDLIEKNGFIEYAQYSGNYYGTSVKAVQDIQASGKRPILDIDSQGVKIVKQHHAYLDPIYVFIAPPTLESLHERLTGRKTETEETIQKRLSAASSEITYANQPGSYDAIIVNDQVDRAYKLLETIATNDDPFDTKFDTLPEHIVKL